MFATSLSDFAALVAKALADGAPPAPDGPTQSLPLGLSKDDAINKFQGAIFKLKDPEGFAWCAAPFARSSAAGIELVLASGPPAIAGGRKYRKADWLDTHIDGIAFKVLHGGDWTVGMAPTTRLEIGVLTPSQHR